MPGQTARCGSHGRWRRGPPPAGRRSRPRSARSGRPSGRCGPRWRPSARGAARRGPPGAAPRTPGATSPRGRGAGPRTTAPAPPAAGGRRARPTPWRTGSAETSSRGDVPAVPPAPRRRRALAWLGRGRGLALLRPWHHGAELRPHALDEVVVLLLAHALEVGAPLPALGDPLAGERAAPDVGEDPLHLGPDRRGDQPGAAGVVAVLRGVADRIAHELHPAAVHQVHDQLELVQALEIGQLGPGSGF